MDFKKLRSRLEVRLAGDHLLVKDPHDKKPCGLRLIEDDMLADFKAAKTG